MVVQMRRHHEERLDRRTRVRMVHRAGENLDQPVSRDFDVFRILLSQFHFLVRRSVQNLFKESERMVNRWILDRKYGILELTLKKGGERGGMMMMMEMEDDEE